MKFRYLPEGGDPQTFDLIFDDLTTDEADIIEGAGDRQWGTVAEWFDLINRGGWRAWRVALWLMMLRINPELGFEEVKPKMSQLVFAPFDPDSDEPRPDDADGEPGKSEPTDSATDST